MCRLQPRWEVGGLSGPGWRPLAPRCGDVRVPGDGAGVVREDAHPYDVPTIMCALAGTFRNPHSDPERYIGIALDGLRAPGAELTKLPAVEPE